MSALRDLARIRSLRLLWLGVLISQTGDWIQITAQAWLVTQISDPMGVSIVSASALLPQVLFVLVGGALADQVAKASALRYLALAQIAVSALYTALIVGGLSDIWGIAVFSFALGTFSALFQPVYLSMIPEVTPPHLVSNAMGVSVASLQIARVVGPIVAGVCIAYVGARATYLLNSASFLLAAVPFFLVEATGAKVPARAGIWREVASGARALSRHKLWRSLWVLTAALSFLVLPVFALLPVLLKQRFGLGATGFAWVMALASVSQSAGAIWTAVSKREVPANAGAGVAAAYALGGVAVAVFTTSSSRITGPCLFFLFTFIHGMMSPRISAYAQLHVDPSLRGRAQAFLLFAFSIVPLGQLALGGLAQVLSTATAVMWSAGLFSVASALILLFTLASAPNTQEIPHDNRSSVHE